MPRDPKKKVHKNFNEAIYHRPPTGPSFFSVGIVAAIVILVGSYLAYTKEIPFKGPGYTATAVFDNATTLRPTSPVRIAGVEVGEVIDITLDGELARVEFTVDEAGQPLKTDSQVTIRPRLFLEGNFFLDLQPGSPSAPPLEDGESIPVSQTQTAVQLDQILTTLQQPDRANLSALLDGYGSALADKPTAKQDKGQDPSVQGKSAAEALNSAFKYGARAGKGTAQVSQALLGEQAGDLNRVITKTGVVFGKLASQRSELSSLISNFSVTAGAFAAESNSLEDTIAELAPTLEQAQPSLAKFNATLPPLRTYARALTPGVKELPATIKAGTPWLRQTIALVQPNELGGVAKDLKFAQPQLSAGANFLAGLLPQLQATSRCVSKVLVPTGDTVINDSFSTGSPNYYDFFYAAASQAGMGGNFDGNGQMLRFQFAGGPAAVSTPIDGASGLNTPLYGYTIQNPTGTQPVRPASEPPVRKDVLCEKNALPDLNGPAATVAAPSPAP